jgi:Glyoxalase/Bleomycin resistance protein/Dioxygenase superfamily
MDAVPFHIGIVTNDIEASMPDLSAGLGVSWTTPTKPEGVVHTVDGAEQHRPLSCISRQGPIHIDLMQGDPGTVWDANGPRLHHFAYWTNDLRGDIDRLAKDGWRLEMTKPDAAGEPTVFAYLVDDNGFRLELIDDAGRDDYAARIENSD